MQNQIHYSQPIVHTSLTQNYTVQGPEYRVAYWQDAPPQIPPPVQADPKANVQPLMDSNMIAETIRLHFGIRPRPLDRLVYRKPYPNWIYKIPLSRGYKTPNFSNFLLRMENLQWNILAVYEPMWWGQQNEYYKLQPFPLSLTGATFSWYSSLAPNSIHAWADIERLFLWSFL